MKYLLVIFALFATNIGSFNTIQAQQISHVDLLLHPDKFKAAVTGTGSGDLQKADLQTGQMSAQGAFEMCFGTHLTKKRRNLITFPIIFRYNVLSLNRILPGSGFNVRSIAFIDNNQTINFGLRTRTLTEIGEDKLLYGPVFDYSYSNYSAQDTIDQIKFSNHIVSAGYQLGVLMETNAGPLAIQLAPAFNFINVSNETPLAFQKALDSPNVIGSNFIGGSTRLLFQFNDLAFFFDLKKFFPIGTSRNIAGFTDKPIIAFGGSAMGAFLKFKKN